MQAERALLTPVLSVRALLADGIEKAGALGRGRGQQSSASVR
jgi:hypothetical protein